MAMIEVAVCGSRRGRKRSWVKTMTIDLNNDLKLVRF